MKDRVSKFEKFIQENEAKRRRAIQKYQQEVKIREQKTSEYELLLQQLEELKARYLIYTAVQDMCTHPLKIANAHLLTYHT